MSQETVRFILWRSIILAVIIVLGWIFLIAPRISEPSRMASETEDLKRQAASLDSQANSPALVEQQFTQATTVANDMAVKYPETVESTGLSSAIEEAARVAGIAPGSIPPITPSEPVINNGAALAEPGTETGSETPPPATDAQMVESATVTFDIFVTGNGDQIASFVEALPLQSRAIFVNKVTLVPSGDRAGVFSATLSCSSLLIKPVPVPPNSLPPSDNSNQQEGPSAP